MIIPNSRKFVVKQALTADSIVIATSLMKAMWQPWKARFVHSLWFGLEMIQQKSNDTAPLFSTGLHVKHSTL